MKVYLKKMPGGALLPESAEDTEALASVKNGQIVSAEIKQPRNYPFLKKYMALINVGFEAFEPDEQEYKGQVVEKNRERFRDDIQILAGFGEPVFDINGDLRMKSKSIAFGNMDEEEFGKLYNSVINVLLKRVLHNYTREDVDSVVNQIVGFT